VHSSLLQCVVAVCVVGSSKSELHCCRATDVSVERWRGMSVREIARWQTELMYSLALYRSGGSKIIFLGEIEKSVCVRETEVAAKTNVLV